MCWINGKFHILIHQQCICRIYRRFRCVIFIHSHRLQIYIFHVADVVFFVMCFASCNLNAMSAPCIQQNVWYSGSVCIRSEKCLCTYKQNCHHFEMHHIHSTYSKCSTKSCRWNLHRFMSTSNNHNWIHIHCSYAIDWYYYVEI